MTLAFVRHGQTEANRDGVLLGRSDPVLTGLGREQAELLAARFADGDVERVLTSPLRRCRETAALIAASCGGEVEVDERLVEVDYGEWDLVAMSALPTAAAASWRSDPTFAPPGGESLQAVARRVEDFCRDRAGAPGTTVAVSHVSPIKAAVAWAVGAGPLLAWRLRLDVASVTSVVGPPDAPLLRSFNETGHLA